MSDDKKDLTGVDKVKYMRGQFKHFRSFFQRLCDEGENVDNLAPYFETKAEILHNTLYSYTGNVYEFAMEFGPSEGRKFTVDRSEDEESKRYIDITDHVCDSKVLSDVFVEFIRDDYDPPSDNFAAMQLHLQVLFMFYEFIRPRAISISLILQLDISTLKLIKVAAESGSIPSMTKDKRRIKSVTKSKKKQSDETKLKILAAYQSLDPRWTSNDETKKPIVLDGQNVSINKLSEKVWLKLQECHKDIPTQQWIAICLKELKKKETI